MARDSGRVPVLVITVRTFAVGILRYPHGCHDNIYVQTIRILILISNLKIRPPLSPEGAERAPSVDGVNRGKRLGAPRRHMTTWRYRLPVLRFWVHCAYSHTPTAWVAKTPSCRRRPTKPKTENWPGPGRKLGRGPAKYTTTTTLSSQQQQQQPKQAAPASPLNARLASRIISRNQIAGPLW